MSNCEHKNLLPITGTCAECDMTSHQIVSLQRREIAKLQVQVDALQERNAELELLNSVNADKNRKMTLKRDALQAQVPRWIPVGEGLPDVSDPVLVFDNGVVQEAVLQLNGSGDGVTYFECMADEDITFLLSDNQYWMPLPAPPEQESE